MQPAATPFSGKYTQRVRHFQLRVVNLVRHRIVNITKSLVLFCNIIL